MNTTWTQVQNAIKTGSWNAIYAEDDQQFNAIVAQMIRDAKDYGYAECVEGCRGEALARKAAEDAILQG
jgi:multiple sugar transport system substrate-binding protein/putative aldouronate transport system substrate-binding protein